MAISRACLNRPHSPSPQLPVQGAALIKGLKVNEMVQAMNTLTGLEFRLPKLSYAGSLGVKPIVAAGFTTPISARESVRVYKSTQEAFDLFGISAKLTDKPYLALSTPDRERFYFQYYGGVRFKWIEDQQGSSTLGLQPAYFDVTFGQNAAVSGACLCGAVWRLAGFFPIPGLNGISVFGELIQQFRKGRTGNPLFLAAADQSFTLPDPRVAIVSPAVNRDYYHIGIGIDVSRVIQYIQTNYKKKS